MNYFQKDAGKELNIPNTGKLYVSDVVDINYHAFIITYYEHALKYCTVQNLHTITIHQFKINIH